MQRSNLEINYGQNRKIIFKIPQGVTAPLVFQIKNKADKTPVDLTGSTFVCQIRSNYADKSETVIRSITETANGTGDKITADRFDGKFTITLSAATTTELSTERNYYLEVKISAPDGTVTRRYLANIEILPEVARV